MKIIIVDDSIVFRSAISGALKQVDGLEVCKTLANGSLAVDYLKGHEEIDLAILDLEMPEMDGLTAVKEIRKFNSKVVLIIFTSATNKSAEKTMDALNSGANEFILKPVLDDTNESLLGQTQLTAELVEKVVAFKSRKAAAPERIVFEKVNTETLASQSVRGADLIVIGSSTGGPEALSKVFHSIDKKIQVPMLIVQHMPALFTAKMAEMLNNLSPIQVAEATSGKELQPNVCYVAPGDYHMVFEKNLMKLNQNEKVCFVRPAVDVLLNSLAENYTKKIAVIILTGMGEDGANGCQKLSESGADIYVQDKESSVVWGMPGAVYKNTKCNVVQLSEVGSLIMKLGKAV